MNERLHLHRKILYDLALHHLEPLPSNFSRLAYLAGLRNPSSGTYAETELCRTYGEGPVHRTLCNCHEELFERSLELSLEQQQKELSGYFEIQREGLPRDIQQRRDLLESWIPQQAPDYLKELFRSNVRVLCELLHEQSSKARSGK